MSPLLADLLADDPDPLVRRIAIDVAAKVGGEDLEPVLELARTDPEEIIRRAAARSLAN